MQIKDKNGKPVPTSVLFLAGLFIIGCAVVFVVAVVAITAALLRWAF